MAFADNLRELPSISHLAELQLLDAEGQLVASIPNLPGKTGSLSVYAALSAEHGGQITAAAAQRGLELFAEHTADARLRPGAHPNIDRLLEIIASGQSLTVKAIAAE